MATPPSDDTITLFRLLADQQWHQYEEIRDAVARSVPPGRALRKYDEAYKSGRRQRNAQVISSPLSEDDQILYGARKCAQITISSWKGRGVIQKIEDGVKFIRVKPGFQAWGVTLGSPSPEPGQESPQGPSQGPSKAQDPGFEGQGHTEVPPGDSEPSETRTVVADEGSGGGEAPAVQGEQIAALQDEVVDAQTYSHTEGPSGYMWPPVSPGVAHSELRECPECGLGVLNEEKHRLWHEALPEQIPVAPEMALVDEMRFRSLMDEVVATALDGFQRGMQAYLDQQFALVSSQLFALRTDHPAPQKWSFREGPFTAP